jgi:hypothetical protein
MQLCSVSVVAVAHYQCLAKQLCVVAVLDHTASDSKNMAYGILWPNRCACTKHFWHHNNVVAMASHPGAGGVAP